MGETTEYARRVVDLIREYDLEAVRKFPHAAHYVMGIAARKIERITAQLEQVTRERDALQVEIDVLNEEYYAGIHTIRPAVDAEACSMSDDEFKAEAKRRGYNLIKRPENVKLMPCVCGNKRPQLWCGAGRTEFYLCAECNLRGEDGKSDREAKVKWNEAVIAARYKEVSE